MAPSDAGSAARRGRGHGTLALACLAQAAVAALVMWLVATSGTACSGADTFSHLFVGQSLLGGLSALFVMALMVMSVSRWSSRQAQKASISFALAEACSLFRGLAMATPCCFRW